MSEQKPEYEIYGAEKEDWEAMTLDERNLTRVYYERDKLLQQVSELTKENEQLTVDHYHASGNLEIATKENSRLREDKTNLETSVKNLVEMYEEKVEERKELVEALREVLTYWNMTVAPRPPHPYYTFVSRVKSLLSKFEV